MSGKSYFVKELLERDHIEYEDHRKCRKIHWFNGQYQDMFKDKKRPLGQDIYFREGLPMFQLDLSDIDPKYNKFIVLDDQMDLAVDSPQGRHRQYSTVYRKTGYCTHFLCLNHSYSTIPVSIDIKGSKK